MFCPAVASDLKYRSPTMQVPGREVPVFAGAVLAAPVASCLPVRVLVLPKVATVPLAAGPVIVTPSGMVKVAALAGAVIVTLFTVVTVAAPSVGVTSVGEVENTRLVLVVPVVPAAVNPVMLLKQVMVAEEQFVPPLATGKTADPA